MWSLTSAPDNVGVLTLHWSGWPVHLRIRGQASPLQQCFGAGSVQVRAMASPHPAAPSHCRLGLPQCCVQARPGARCMHACMLTDQCHDTLQPHGARHLPGCPTTLSTACQHAGCILHSQLHPKGGAIKQPDGLACRRRANQLQAAQRRAVQSTGSAL